MRREEYLLDSAHHGLAMNPAGTKLCVAGTMSDYAAIVDRSIVRLQDRGARAQAVLGDQQRATAATASSRSAATTPSSVISYRKRREIARIQVGDHPQRMRMGKVRAGWLGTQKPRR